MIPEAAVGAAARWMHDEEGYFELFEDAPDFRKKHFREKAAGILEAAAPHMAAQALADAVDAFPLETITAPDNAVVWLMRRAEEMNPRG